MMDRIAGGVAGVRRRRPFVDRLVRVQEHYGSVRASQQAGAMTYYAFLAFFPLLALSFFVVGLVSEVWPDANVHLRTVITSVLPSIIGQEEGQLSLQDIRTFSGWAALLSLAAVLYTGLGWLSAMRAALQAVFQVPETEWLGFLGGKLRDLMTLPVIGTLLFVAVVLTSFVGRFAEDLLLWAQLDVGRSWLVRLLTVGFGIVANAVLFYVAFRMLARPHLPRSSLWRGALLGALAFEVLKQLSSYLLAATKNQPAFQAFGIALILVVWINYFSRIVLYSAAFAYTSPAAVAARRRRLPPGAVQGPRTPTPEELLRQHRRAGAVVAPFAAGGATALGLVAWVRRKRSERSVRSA